MSSESKQGKSVDEISIKYLLMELHPLVSEFILVVGRWSDKNIMEGIFSTSLLSWLLSFAVDTLEQGQGRDT